jgi:hypothetical protein
MSSDSKSAVRTSAAHATTRRSAAHRLRRRGRDRRAPDRAIAAACFPNVRPRAAGRPPRGGCWWSGRLRSAWRSDPRIDAVFVDFQPIPNDLLRISIVPRVRSAVVAHASGSRTTCDRGCGLFPTATSTDSRACLIANVHRAEFAERLRALEPEALVWSTRGSRAGAIVAGGPTLIIDHHVRRGSRRGRSWCRC